MCDLRYETEALQIPLRPLPREAPKGDAPINWAQALLRWQGYCTKDKGPQFRALSPRSWWPITAPVGPVPEPPQGGRHSPLYRCYCAAPTAWPATNPHRHKAPTAQAPQCSTQRAGITPPRAEGDGLSGVTSDRESFAFISAPACCVGGVPLTRAKNPWAMPEAST